MVAGIFISSLAIDVVTYVFVKLALLFAVPLRSLGLIRKKVIRMDLNDYKVSVIIPAFNEEKHIRRAIESCFNQVILPEQVIVIDDCSTDNTEAICKKLQQKYKNLIVIRQKQNKGKAYNISYILKEFELTELTLVLDGDTYLGKNFIREIIKPFTNKRVVISTGVSLPVKPNNFFGKIIYSGSIFQYLFFCFRKEAHGYRNAIGVITGDSSAYRTTFLKQIGGFPQGTQTEDTDITWLALEQGHRIAFQRYAQARSNDAPTITGHVKQVIRWYSGSIQCFMRHGRNLWKAKPLLFTTLIPIYLDTIIYGPAFLLALILLPIFPTYTIFFFTADFIFTSIAILIINPMYFLKLPQIYVIKFIWAYAWVIAFTKTVLEFLLGKRYWGGTWERDNYFSGNENKSKINNFNNINSKRVMQPKLQH